MRVDRKRQSMPIHYRHDFHAFSALCRSNVRPPPFAIMNVASTKHSSSSSAPLLRSSSATSIDTRRRTSTRHQARKRRCTVFVVGIALRKHVPLRTGVENPQRCFKHTTRGNRLAARSTVRDVVVRKMVSDASSPIVGQSKHPTFIDDRAQSAILR